MAKSAKRSKEIWLAEKRWGKELKRRIKSRARARHGEIKPKKVAVKKKLNVTNDMRIIRKKPGVIKKILGMFRKIP